MPRPYGLRQRKQREDREWTFITETNSGNTGAATRAREWSDQRTLADLARSGRPERIKAAFKGRMLSEAVKPPAPLGRWSTRSMARHLGVSKATVQRVWSINDIKPHRTRIFKLSCDEKFEAKFWDVKRKS
jgi:SMC interacting uncharacterized protein involved in chromosome segregation